MSAIDKFHHKFKHGLRGAARKSLMLDKISNQLMPPKAQDDLDDPAHIARTSILFGCWMVVLVFGVLGLWSVLAHIDSAAIAPGKVILDENSKSISHLEGGIVESIHEAVGSRVKRGDPLITLREVRAKAQVDLLQGQLDSNLAIEARLVAERDEMDSITFPDRLLNKAAALPKLEQDLENIELALQDNTLSDAQREALNEEFQSAKLRVENALHVKEILDNQRRIFTSRTENFRGQLDILGTRIAKHEQEINGFQIQADSMRDQIALLNEEIAVVKKLVK
ncbi:MAG: hypothetical protein MK052_05110, partial [Alphaproteobacteria bacterium]|nr:hypothetical protein [Alphaproteobacteria bacterium]